MNKRYRAPQTRISWPAGKPTEKDVETPLLAHLGAFTAYCSRGNENWWIHVYKGERHGSDYEYVIDVSVADGEEVIKIVEVVLRLAYEKELLKLALKEVRR